MKAIRITSRRPLPTHVLRPADAAALATARGGDTATPPPPRDPINGLPTGRR